ncbi:MAG: hypothetical protein FWE76_04490 [Symbiobacteriaceae bacterium]|nr:hypothetical protein [Symbiobacteriaceae bacterium]
MEPPSNMVGEKLGMILVILGWILLVLLGLLMVLLLLLALPFRYAVAASWKDGNGTFDWQLTWAGFIPLDKILAKRLRGQSKSGKLKESKETGKGKDAAKTSAVVRSSEDPVREAEKSEYPYGSRVVDTSKTTAGEPPRESTAKSTGGKTESVKKAAKAGKVTDPDPASVEDEEEQGPSWKESARLLWQLRHWLISWFRRLWDTLHLAPLRLCGVCGLWDPFVTSELFRRVFVIKPFLPAGIALDLEPHYQQEVLELELSLAGWLSPLQLLWLLLKLYFDDTTKQLIRLYR